MQSLCVTWKIFTASIYYISLKITLLLETKFTRIGLQAAPHRNTTGYISPRYKSHQNSDLGFLDQRVQAHSSSKQHFRGLAPTSHTSCFSKQVAHIMSWIFSTAVSNSPVHTAIPPYRQPFHPAGILTYRGTQPGHHPKAILLSKTQISSLSLASFNTSQTDRCFYLPLKAYLEGTDELGQASWCCWYLCCS